MLPKLNDWGVQERLRNWWDSQKESRQLLTTWLKLNMTY